VPLAVGGAVALGQAPVSASAVSTASLEQTEATPIKWHRSFAVGATDAGFLVRGVKLPPEGDDYFTWDPVLGRSPNRGWRRWGADSTLRSLLGVLAAHRAAHPGAPRIGIADISRPSGGPFGRRFGALGHASHQNGLDVDVHYPRLDGKERTVGSVAQIDRALAQDLVRRFVAAGAVYVFVGPNTGLGRGGSRSGAGCSGSSITTTTCTCASPSRAEPREPASA
jgi:murein endopeptidase